MILRSSNERILVNFGTKPFLFGIDNYSKGDNIITIPGTKKIKYLEENIKAVNVHLSPEELSEIRSIINSIEIIGLRYPEEHCASLNL
ncbi:unnamed protein product [Rhizophagus irregularis]|nr:unnamed protein product [Rhizophagus irregularis]